MLNIIKKIFGVEEKNSKIIDRNLEAEKIFVDIYKGNSWNSKESVSGSGQN